MTARTSDRDVMRSAIRAGAAVIIVIELLVFAGGFALGRITG